MTLGRTASGAIKLKTDGGLRAVECGCCAPCEDFSYAGKIITKSEYDSWRKGGQITLGGTIQDTAINSQYQIDQGCLNGVCTWSYANSITVPPNTCVFQFNDIGQSASCTSNYYGEQQNPSIHLIATAFKSKDEPDVYRAALYFGMSCPYRLYFSPCWGDMCWTSSWTSSMNRSFAEANLLPGQFFWRETFVTFLGAQFYYGSIIDYPPPTPSATANLSFTFTPKP